MEASLAKINICNPMICGQSTIGLMSYVLDPGARQPSIVLIMKHTEHVHSSCCLGSY